VDEFYVSKLAGQVDLSRYRQGICLGVGFGCYFLDCIGYNIPCPDDESVWSMSSEIVLSPQVWNWYVGFFMSMGLVSAAAISFASALLLIDWLYRIAKKIESQPTPQSFRGAYFNLSRFQAIVIGVFLAPIVAIVSYYCLFFLVWKLTPNMISAPPPDPGALSYLEDTSSMASLVLFAGAISFGIIAIIFFLLYSYAKRMCAERAPIGFIKRFVRRYFRENLFVGVLLTLIAFPVLTYFLYNMALLVVYFSPAGRHEMARIVFPNAESLYMHSAEIIGSWLKVIIFIPFMWLFVQGVLLLWRYIRENPGMHLIFMRSVKFYIFSFLGFAGCAAMYYWAWFSLKFIVETGFR